MKGHKAAITCMDWAADNRSLITGSKDCSLIKCKYATFFLNFFSGALRGLGDTEKAFLPRKEV